LGEISDSQYYQNALDIIREAEEKDVIRISINSEGGSLDTAIEFIHALSTTKANTVADVVGRAYSAASIITMCCDDMIIYPFSSMMIHTASYGIEDTEVNISKYVGFFNKHISNIIRTVYKDFLSNEEIESVISGDSIYLCSQEITKRFEFKVQQEQED